MRRLTDDHLFGGLQPSRAERCLAELTHFPPAQQEDLGDGQDTYDEAAICHKLREMTRDHVLDWYRRQFGKDGKTA